MSSELLSSAEQGHPMSRGQVTWHASPHTLLLEQEYSIRIAWKGPAHFVMARQGAVSLGDSLAPFPIGLWQTAEGTCSASIPPGIPSSPPGMELPLSETCSLLTEPVGDGLGFSSPGFSQRKKPRSFSQPVQDSPPFFPTKVHMSLQLRKGATWLPRLFRTFLAVSLR